MQSGIAESISPLRRFGNAGDEYRGLAVSGDGQSAYVGVRSGVEEWNVASGERLRSLTCGGETHLPRAVLLTPDGRQVLLAAGTSAYAWRVDGAAGHRVIAQHEGDIRTMVVLPDERRIASAGSEGSIRVWDLETAKQVLAIRAHAHELMDMAHVPGSARLVSVSTDRTLRVWDADSGEQIACLTGPYRCDLVRRSITRWKVGCVSVVGPHASAMGLWRTRPRSLASMGIIPCAAALSRRTAQR